VSPSAEKHWAVLLDRYGCPLQGGSLGCKVKTKHFYFTSRNGFDTARVAPLAIKSWICFGRNVAFGGASRGEHHYGDPAGHNEKTKGDAVPPLQRRTS
jgi:hypothetical protein